MVKFDIVNKVSHYIMVKFDIVNKVSDYIIYTR